MMKYYVYKLIDPRNSLPFYIGKGSNNRAEWHIDQIKKGKKTSNRYKDRIINKLLLLNLMPIIEYVYYTDDEEHAYNVEQQFITEYGRRNIDQNGVLTNICEDNRPPHGKYSKERKELYRQRMIGNTINTGRKQSEKEKTKRAASLKAAYDSGRRCMSDATKKIISETHRGKIITEETRTKMKHAAKINGAKRKGKTYEEIYGLEMAAILKERRKTRLPPNQKPITVDNKKYPSIKSAAASLGISEYKAKKRAQNDN